MNRLLNWIQSLFRPVPGMRTPAEARRLRADMQTIVERQTVGFISCPWHIEKGPMSCTFNKSTNTVHCSGCQRSTDMENLLRRLRAPDVYERAVE